VGARRKAQKIRRVKKLGHIHRLSGTTERGRSRHFGRNSSRERRPGVTQLGGIPNVRKRHGRFGVDVVMSGVGLPARSIRKDQHFRK